jgi:hypothetical protein
VDSSTALPVSAQGRSMEFVKSRPVLTKHSVIVDAKTPELVAIGPDINHFGQAAVAALRLSEINVDVSHRANFLAILSKLLNPPIAALVKGRESFLLPRAWELAITPTHFEAV